MSTSSAATWKSVRDWAVRASPVFIVGAPRSGTSILYRTLQQHDAFRPRRIDLEEPKLFDQLWTLPLWRRRPPTSLTRFMLDDEERWGSFVDLIRSPSPRSFASSVVAKSPWRADPRVFQALGNIDVAQAFYFFAHQARGANRLVSKSPDETAHAFQIWKAFPAATLIFIHRDPVDVFASYRRRSQTDPAADWAAISPERFCKIYRTAAENALRVNANWPDKFVMIDYEFLVQRPEETFARIMPILGERFDVSMLGSEEFRDRDFRPDPKLFGEIRPGDVDPLVYVSASEAHKISSRLGDLRSRLHRIPPSIGGNSLE